MGFKAGSVRRLDLEKKVEKKEKLKGANHLPEEWRKELEGHVGSIRENSPINFVIDEKRWEVKTESGTTVVIKADTEKLRFYEADLNESMAGAIEDAFVNTWRAVNNEKPPLSGKTYRRILFVAVAEGVLKYLRDHAEEGFEVGEIVQKLENHITSSESGTTSGGGISVRQNRGEGNRVKSKIEGGEGDIALKVEDLTP